MAIAVVATYTGSTSTLSTAVTISTPSVGNLLVVLAIEIGNTAATWGTATMSGSPGGNFTDRSPARGLVQDRVVVSGDTTTVTIVQTGTAQGSRYFIAELSGMDTSSPFDRAAGSTYVSGTSTPVPLGANIAQANEYVVACTGQNGVNGGQVAATDSFTLYTTTTDTRRVHATRITSSIVSPNPTLSYSTARAGQYVTAAWKEATAAAADVLDPMGMTGFFGA